MVPFHGTQSHLVCRAAGGAVNSRVPFLFVEGLSPRGRGSHRLPSRRRLGVGSIPARAGEPRYSAGSAAAAGVYPRAGGGASGRALCPHDLTGLSPRGRGSRQRDLIFLAISGSIPARAGEPPQRAPVERPARVYPRAGGGAAEFHRARLISTGLSPRGRGSLYPRRPAESGSGSIPARAGEPHGGSRLLTRAGVYPRAGGGARCVISSPSARRGLSPRGRGSQFDALLDRARERSIPARAGEPAVYSWPTASSGVYPRAGGGAGSVILTIGAVVGLSPRGRGSLSAVRPRA